MTWDEIATGIVFLALVAWALWGLTGPHKPLSEEEAQSFKDAGEP